ncbi:MAG: hypothetical protein NXY57DRAFT_959944 [Lentinula lateritia]|nr:MAG: hypothetical protein NXY57DRAFT_959944 [Lentinula lateritia]
MLLEFVAVAQAGCVIGKYIKRSSLLVLTQISTAFISIALATVETFSQMEPQLRCLAIVVNVIATVDDIVIAIVLSFLFQTSKNGFRSTSTILNKLTLHAVNTGAITSICAISTLVSMLAAPNTLIYVAFYFCIGRLYTASLLATLNARNGVSNAANNVETTSGRMSPLAFRSFANGSAIDMGLFNKENDTAINGMDSVHLETENNYTNRQVIYELDDMSLDNINHKNIQTSYQLPTVPQEVHFCAI